MEQPIYSNIVTVLVVNATPQAGDTVAATATISPTVAVAYPAPTDTVNPTVTETATPDGAPVPRGEGEPTTSPTAEATVAAPTATLAAAGKGAPEDTQAPLPETNAGVPLAGFLLMGMTLFIRTIRLHRERERI